MFSFFFLPAENLYYGIGLHFIPPPQKKPKQKQNKTEETAQVVFKANTCSFFSIRLNSI